MGGTSKCAVASWAEIAATSWGEIEAQQAELLPGRTVLSAGGGLPAGDLMNGLPIFGGLTGEGGLMSSLGSGGLGGGTGG